jgi:uncharacterized protein (DUF1697 family)
MDYILLLRGINVGGNHRVVMADLRAQLTAAGYLNVTSYINSGNVMFTATTPDVSAAVKKVLTDNYAFPISFVVLTAQDYLDAVDAAPAWWGVPGDLRHNALFKLPEYNPAFDERIRAQMTEYDQIAITEHVIFWSSPAKVNYSRALYAKMLPEPYYPCVSIRNRNTTIKLAALLRTRSNPPLKEDK